MKRARCSGVVLTGYWKGKPCGASALYTHEGEGYCAAHLAVAVEEPERFVKAAGALARRRAKEEV